jgi:para-nitrobenzyl esterase
MAMWCTRVLLVASILVLFASCIAALSDVVQTQSGFVRGRPCGEGDTMCYLGIPFAAPPVGPLRWKAPQPAPRWEGIRDTKEYSPGCLQPNGTSFPGRRPLLQMSEDCLYLNVIRPNTNDVLPVMVWIYGGNYQSGATSLYPAQRLANLSNTVVVSMNYRVNIFGFMASTSLLTESRALNYGIQDQQLALKWVKQNIANFGGDTSNVMIFGESAGGSSVGMHLLLHSSWPYYHKAVLQSPGPWSFRSLDKAVKDGQTLFSLVPKCGGIQNPVEQLKCIRQLDGQQLLQLSLQTNLNALFTPVIDGVQLLASPASLFNHGRFNAKVPVIVGSNHDEGTIFTATLRAAVTHNNTISTELSETLYYSILNFIFPIESVRSEITSWYQAEATPGHYFEALSHLLSDFYITCGTSYIADAFLKYSTQSREHYRYLFAQHWSSTPYRVLNATHIFELPYLFGMPDLIILGSTWTEEERQLSHQMINYWSNFAYSSNPNQHETGEEGQVPFWPLYTSPLTYTTLQIDGKGNSLIGNWDVSYCEHWKPILEAPIK